MTLLVSVAGVDLFGKGGVETVYCILCSPLKMSHEI